MKCYICDKELDEEEIKSPYEDGYGHNICDECFMSRYSHICPLCGNVFCDDVMKDVSPAYLLVTGYAGEEMGVDAGIYEIVAYPFFRDCMTEISLIHTAIKRISDMPESFNEDDCFADMYYVCDECIKGIKQ